MKIDRRLMAIPLRMQQTFYAGGEILGRKVPEVVLKRIWDELIAQPDLGLAYMPKPCVGQSPLHELVEVIVMRELDMAAEIPGEALVIDKRCGEPPGIRVGLENQEVGVPKLVQAICRAQPGAAGAKNNYARRMHRRALKQPPLSLRWWRRRFRLRVLTVALDFCHSCYAFLLSTPYPCL